jgi:maltose O-acetyltransferase
MTNRQVSLPSEVRARVDQFVGAVDERLSSDEETADVVQEILARLHGDGAVYDRWRAGESGSRAERVRLDAYDPRNVMGKSDPWAEKDEEQFQESKPLRWLWRGFDASPLAHNVGFALPFRRMVANHLFAEAGDDLQLFRGITFPYGHNIGMGDRTVVHENVLLDDRGELAIGDHVSIADDATLHSHSHHIVDQSDVSIYRTVVEDDARLGAEAMLAAGARVGHNAMVGAKALVRGDVPAHHVAVGMPAKSVRVKPGWESVADDTGRLPDNRETRRIEYDLPDDLDWDDEFQRDLTPPDAPDATDG